ncbi:InlB B-repeat-containing protein, partial [Listeria monocytogenes]|nr:InlB B-repeat-containing protein [Listeria monocytogenes]
MVDWGKIVRVWAMDQSVNLTLDIDWSEKVTIDLGEQVFKEPTISDPSATYDLPGYPFRNGIRVSNDDWEYDYITGKFSDNNNGEEITNLNAVEEAPGKLVIEGLENVNQTLVASREFGRGGMSYHSQFYYSSEFKVKLNQVFKKVTFDNEGIESSNQIPVTDLIKEPTTPTKQGYAFLGWYDARSGGTKWDFVTDKMPNKDMTLYAQYSKQSYKVIFDNAGNKYENSAQFETLVKEPTAPTKQGYTFTGWYDAETGGTKWDFTKDKMPASDLTLYARY